MVNCSLFSHKGVLFYQFAGFVSKGMNLILIFSVLTFVSANAQKISKVEVTEIKKGENLGSFSLQLYDFPREASAVKPYVNRISSINGVIAFNVLSHPENKPAQAILKVQESDLKQSIIKEVLCAFNASSFVFRKKTFSDCNSFILNKK